VCRASLSDRRPCVESTVCACLWLVTCAYLRVLCVHDGVCDPRRHACMRAWCALPVHARGLEPRAAWADKRVHTACCWGRLHGIDCTTKKTDPLDLLCLGRARTTATPTARLHGRTQAGGLALILLILPHTFALSLRRLVQFDHTLQQRLDSVVARRGPTAPPPPDDLFCNARF